MTTDTKTPETPETPDIAAAPSPADSKGPGLLHWIVAAGGLATTASTFLAWTYTTEFPGDLTVNGYPGGLQVLTLV
ncbi:MAG TPA: branched-chain amino acid ABC transporter permease, partial [Streptomyces sp.]